MNKLVKDFQLKYPKLCKAMQECSHHYSDTELNPFHLEGDVWSHTMMSCNQAVNQNKNTQIAALLHDIGKPFTRKENHEAAVFPFLLRKKDAVEKYIMKQIRPTGNSL